MLRVRKNWVERRPDGKGILENVPCTEEAAKQLEGWMETESCVYEMSAAYTEARSACNV